VEEEEKESLKDSSILEEHYADIHEVVPQPMCVPAAEQEDLDGDSFWDEMEVFFSSLDFKQCSHP
jgi:hypothetical protein